LSAHNNIFKKKSRIKAPVRDVFAWHTRHGAIERLSPPFDPIKVLERTGGIHPGDKVVLRMKAGPIPYKWHAEHTDFEENRLFRDRQVHGPFKEWNHTHVFEPDGEQACFLEDLIEFSPPFSSFGNFLLSAHVQKKLARIFTYRHTTTQSDIKHHLRFKNQPRKTILISGASGLIGSTIIPFLTTGGHQVIRLVRKQHPSGNDEICWDPEAGVLEPKALNRMDAVIHLSGENIGQNRWTKKKKKKIINSRVKSTNLLANAIASLENPPDVFICASATGFYGNRGYNLMSESDHAGDDFISRVCTEWEKSAAPAVHKGIRTVFMRIGVVLTPQGGALARLMLPSQLCLGGKIGSGLQYVSWISIEDVVGAMYHILMNPAIHGPVNLVSPNPVSNLEMVQALGQVLNRPSIVPIPALLIRLLFGEMGEEILLSSTRVTPEKLLDTGYSFRYPELKGALLHLLGK